MALSLEEAIRKAASGQALTSEDVRLSGLSPELVSILADPAKLKDAATQTALKSHIGQTQAIYIPKLEGYFSPANEQEKRLLHFAVYVHRAVTWENQGVLGSREAAHQILTLAAQIAAGLYRELAREQLKLLGLSSSIADAVIARVKSDYAPTPEFVAEAASEHAVLIRLLPFVSGNIVGALISLYQKGCGKGHYKLFQGQNASIRRSYIESYTNQPGARAGTTLKSLDEGASYCQDPSRLASLAGSGGSPVSEGVAPSITTQTPAGIALDGSPQAFQIPPGIMAIGVLALLYAVFLGGGK